MTRKKRRKAELDGRAMASSVSNQHPTSSTKDVAPGAPDVKSMSSASSDPVAHPLKYANPSDEETERDPPIPTPPVYEAVTWVDPPPKSTNDIPSQEDMRQQAFNLTQRAPSRRGSVADSTATQTIGRPDTTISHPVVMKTVPCVIQGNASPPTSWVGTNAIPWVTIVMMRLVFIYLSWGPDVA